MNEKTFKIFGDEDNIKRLELFKDWCDFLIEHEAEAIKTLQQENLTTESMELYRDTENNLYVRCASTVREGCVQKPSDQSQSMNRVHKKLWQQLKKKPLEYDLGESLILDRILYKLTVE